MLSREVKIGIAHLLFNGGRPAVWPRTNLVKIISAFLLFVGLVMAET